MDQSAREAAEQGKGCYRSCHFLEKAVLVGESVKVCCLTNSVNYATDSLRMIAAASEKTPSAAQILERKRQMRIANQTEEAPCEGCYLLVRKEWKANLTGFDCVALTGYMHCNLACSYCVNYTPRPDPPLRRSLVGVVDQFRAEGAIQAGAQIDLGGGEPTLFPEFKAIMARCVEHGLSARVFTNSTSYSEVLAEGLCKGLFSIVTSVDSGTRETYRRIKTKDFFDRVWQNLGKYAAANADRVVVKYLLVQGNLAREDLAGFIERARSEGIKQINIARNVYSIRDGRNAAPRAILEAAACLAALAREKGISWECSDLFNEEDRRWLKERLAAAGETLATYDAPQSDIYPEFMFTSDFTSDSSFRGRLEFALSSGVSVVPLIFYVPIPLEPLPPQVISWLLYVENTGGTIFVRCPPGTREAGADGETQTTYLGRLAVVLDRYLDSPKPHVVDALREFNALLTIEPATATVTGLSFIRRDAAHGQTDFALDKGRPGQAWHRRFVLRARRAVGARARKALRLVDDRFGAIEQIRAIGERTRKALRLLHRVADWW